MKHKIVAVALAGAFAFVACAQGGGQGGGAGAGSTPSPEIPSGTITYYSTEFAFEGPDTIASGETTFHLVNSGEQDHMIVMVELLQGKTIADVNTYLEEHGTKGRPPAWAKEVKVEAYAKPGKEASSKPVNLTPGTYAMLCFVTDKETKKEHVLMGMTKELTVQ